MENTALVALEDSELDMVAGGCGGRRNSGGRRGGGQRNVVIVNIGDDNVFDASNGGTIIIGVGGDVRFS